MDLHLTRKLIGEIAASEQSVIATPPPTQQRIQDASDTFHNEIDFLTEQEKKPHNFTHYGVVYVEGIR